MATDFGSIPYHGCYYGEPVPSLPITSGRRPTDEMALLKSILESLKYGDFSASKELIPLLTSESFDVRQYAHQLFAHVCNHEEAEWFERALDRVSDMYELYRLAMRLGETLSPRAVPMLLRVLELVEDDELAGYVSLGLGIILGPGFADESELRQPGARRFCERMVARLEPNTFYYHGLPVFTGDVTKELVTQALIANRERRPLMIVGVARLLSNFSGIQCPVEPGQMVTDEDVRGVFAYVQKLAKMEWDRGPKYFYRHAIR